MRGILSSIGERDFEVGMIPAHSQWVLIGVRSSRDGAKIPTLKRRRVGHPVEFQNLNIGLQRLKPHMWSLRWHDSCRRTFSDSAFTSAAKACVENKPVIAAINRCATQNQVRYRVFPRTVIVLFPKNFGGSWRDFDDGGRTSLHWKFAGESLP